MGRRSRGTLTIDTPSERGLIPLLATVAGHPLVQPHKKLLGAAALNYTWIPGTGPLVLVLGDNGAGKSLLRRLVTTAAGRGVLGVSAEERGTVRGVTDYGMESIQSTGSISAGVLRKTIQRSRTRIGDHVVMLDEPDLGASDALAGGMGLEIRAWLHELRGIDDPPCYGVFLTTHNRALVRAVVGDDPDPHVLWFTPPDRMEPWPGLATWRDRIDPPRPIEDVLRAAHRTESRVRIVLRGANS